ncbi:hypothetical protein ACVWZ4_004367 [Bradyrhizobium sp. USDA 4472]
MGQSLLTSVVRWRASPHFPRVFDALYVLLGQLKETLSDLRITDAACQPAALLHLCDQSELQFHSINGLYHY